MVQSNCQGQANMYPQTLEDGLSISRDSWYCLVLVLALKLTLKDNKTFISDYSSLVDVKEYKRNEKNVLQSLVSRKARSRDGIVLVSVSNKLQRARNHVLAESYKKRGSTPRSFTSVYFS
jgi:hypothetical protein